MSAERRLAIPGTYPIRIAYNQRPDVIKNRLDRKAASAGEGLELPLAAAKKLLENGKKRTTAAAVLSVPHREIPPQEEIGIVLFTGLITAVDDYIDNNPGISIDRSENEAGSPTMLSKDIPVPNLGMSFGELEEVTLASFSDEKQDSIQSFMNLALTTHPQGEPGHYGFDDALVYRHLTTVPYVETAGHLVELHNNYVDDIPHGAMAVQYLDDAGDIPEDMTAHNMNLAVGLASDVGELNLLQDLSEDPSANKPLRGTLQTRVGYRAIYNATIGDITSGTYRTVFHTLGKIKI